MNGLLTVRRGWLLCCCLLVITPADAAVGGGAGNAPFGKPKTGPGDRMLAEYFASETAALAGRCLTNVQSREDWDRLKPSYRAELFEMLGLEPMPERSELKPVVTGRLEREDMVVEKLHFQSLPGLYVTANLYLPRPLHGPAPTILYLCGHGPVISNGVSYGNKVAYQHHGVWFARNGYVCLVVDTLQLGEIQGLHHGTYREGMWWWNSRGYTPAGVEAWNAIRALDYLQTRPEVDASRFGVTGRSGGGAYSWWVAALDDRIRAAAPVAGITDLRNHVVDGTVEGHCDCMFTVNTYRWDYPQVAALVAPRPLLIVNTDADTIFPLSGVTRTHAQVRRIYQLLKAPDQLGLVIGPGPHKDTQDLQVPVFRWFNRHLKGVDPIIETAAVKLFTPAELKVFATLPSDALNTNIQASFVRAAGPPAVPADAAGWRADCAARQEQLRQKSFRAWPDPGPPLALAERFSSAHEGVRLEAWEFTSQEPVRLRLYVARAAGDTAPERVTLRVLGGDTGPGPEAAGFSFDRWLAGWLPAFGAELGEELEAGGGSEMAGEPNALAAIRRELAAGRQALAWIAPRGYGLSAWSGDARARMHIRRRFMLLGQTVDGMCVHDIRRSLRALRALPDFASVPLTLEADGNLGCAALYGALFESGIQRLRLRRLPDTLQSGPDYLNALRVADVPEVLAMVADKTPVQLQQTGPDTWRYAREVGTRLGWEPDRLLVDSAR